MEWATRWRGSPHISLLAERIMTLIRLTTHHGSLYRVLFYTRCENPDCEAYLLRVCRIYARTSCFWLGSQSHASQHSVWVYSVWVHVNEAYQALKILIKSKGCWRRRVPSLYLRRGSVWPYVLVFNSWFYWSVKMCRISSFEDGSMSVSQTLLERTHEDAKFQWNSEMRVLKGLLCWRWFKRRGGFSKLCFYCYIEGNKI